MRSRLPRGRYAAGDFGKSANRIERSSISNPAAVSSLLMYPDIMGEAETPNHHVLPRRMNPLRQDSSQNRDRTAMIGPSVCVAIRFEVVNVSTWTRPGMIVRDPWRPPSGGTYVRTSLEGKEAPGSRGGSRKPTLPRHQREPTHTIASATR